VDQWFKTGHSFAIGFVTLGAPIGGIFFSVVLKALFDRLSWLIAMVALSSTIAGFLLIGVLLVELKPAGKMPSEPDAPSTDQSISTSDWVFLRSRKFYLFTYTVFGMVRWVMLATCRADIVFPT
jgi:hypothetical protein